MNNQNLTDEKVIRNSTGLDARVSIDDVRDFIVTIDYPNEHSGNVLKDDFKNAAHLIRPDTNIFLLMFLIRAQRFGLPLGFVDPEKVRGVTHTELINTFQYDITYFLLPGYADIYRSDLANVRCQECYTDATFILLLGFVLNHFGRGDDYLKSDIHLDTMGQIVKFINEKTVEVEAPQSRYLTFLYKYRLLIFTVSFFLVYWLTTDLKAAAISTSVMLGVYLIYKSLKALNRVIKTSS